MLITITIGLVFLPILAKDLNTGKYDELYKEYPQCNAHQIPWQNIICCRLPHHYNGRRKHIAEEPVIDNVQARKNQQYHLCKLRKNAVRITRPSAR